MAKTRSPNYPTLGLADAIELARPVFRAENRNKMSRLVLAQHLGYTSLNGRALSRIGALRAYGIIEGAGDDLRLTQDAISAMNAPANSNDGRAAIKRLAFKPDLFTELRKDYPDTLPSVENLRFNLVQRRYTENAAGKAAENFLATMNLISGNMEDANADITGNGDVGGDNVIYGGAAVGDLIQWESGGINQFKTPQRVRLISEDGQWICIDGSETGIAMNEVIVEGKAADSNPLSPPTFSLETPYGAQSSAGTRREVFALDEGDVVLTFPDEMSAASYDDLEGYLNLFLKKARRRAGVDDTVTADQ